jgi:hypothetical protein
MDSLHLNRLSVRVQRVLAVMILACMVISLTLAVVPQKSLAADCDPWINVSCCECWWPSEQDEQKRHCWYQEQDWWEWRCKCPSICD